MSHFTRKTPAQVPNPTNIPANIVTSQLPALPNFEESSLLTTSATTVQMDSEHDYEAIPDNYPLSVHMTAGSIAGVVEHVAMYPVDCVKVC